MNPLLEALVNMALGELEKELAKITPDEEQKWADAVHAKIGGNEPLEFKAIKDAVIIAKALASVKV